MPAVDYLKDLRAHGRRSFTTAEAHAALGGSEVAVRAALRRLKTKGDLASPYRGFYVIVPPEYQRLGCVPAVHFLPELMDHLGVIYYVALLSAAELHGAAHQRPQRLQVMVEKSRRPLQCGEVAVQFFSRADARETPVRQQTTPGGYLRVSSPEATALELVGYADQCGGLGNVATVLRELEAALDPELLLSEARRSPIAWVQRLGYLLELLGAQQKAAALSGHVAEHAHVTTPLVPGNPPESAARSARWKLEINAEVEPDE